jgi:predicted DNA-binding protein
MTDEKKSIKLALDEKTEQRLKAAATRKGVTVEQYCSEAIFKELNSEALNRKFSAKGMIAAGEMIFRGRLSVTDSAELIREAREERQREIETLGKLFAACDEITRGRMSATDSADLIREAREERHRDME